MAPQNKAELLQEMEAGRKIWEEVLAQVSDQDMKQPGVDGSWSIKDVLAHICAYQQYMSASIIDATPGGDGLETSSLDSYYQTTLALARRERPDLPEQLQGIKGDLINEVFAAAFRYKLPREVREMEAAAYLKLYQTVTATSDEVLNTVVTPAGHTLLGLVPNQCYGHYQLHIPNILAFLERKQQGDAA